MGRLSNLKQLDLASNRFENQLPTELYQLRGLEWLSVGGNNDITGRIPSEISLLTELTYLSLSDTTLRSAIPTQYGFLTNLQVLEIANTLVGGTIPEELATLNALARLNLGGSRFRKNIPTFLGRFTALSKS